MIKKIILDSITFVLVVQKLQNNHLTHCHIKDSLTIPKVQGRGAKKKP